jgi:hypothetical protein
MMCAGIERLRCIADHEINTMLIRYFLLVLSLLLSTDVGAAPVSEIDQVEKGSPTQVEDAYPIEHKELDVEALFRYERLRDEHRFVLSPRLEYGIAPNWQVRLTSPIYTGSTDTTGSGDLQAEALRNFQSETRWTPAVAISVEGDFPTGHAGYGMDVTLRVLASKTLGRSIAIPQLHLNFSWTRHGGRLPEERRDLYGIIIGYSRLLTPQMMMVADYFRQQLALAGRTENVLEVGLRRSFSRIMVAALGVGYGLNADSRDFHIQTSIEVTFK